MRRPGAGALVLALLAGASSAAKSDAPATIGDWTRCLDASYAGLANRAGDPALAVELAFQACSTEEQAMLLPLQVLGPEMVTASQVQARAAQKTRILRAAAERAARALTDALVSGWRKANEVCRGGPGNTSASQDACAERAWHEKALAAGGWCYGRKGEFGAQHSWHPCSPDSLRLGD